jgi:hypothetical protein
VACLNNIRSHVTPIIKKKNGDKNDLSNYRPVANLPFVSKLIERVISKQIVTHLNDGGFWDPQQYAYRQFHSCETALLDVLDFVYSGIDDKKVTLLVLLDLSAAFDTIDHNILSQRLQKCGIAERAHKWIIDYLSNRQQIIKCKDVLSSPQPVLYGVPQGSVLGPVLFNVYLTGLRDILISHGIHYVFYADDLQLMLHSTVADLPMSIRKMEACIISVRKWFTSAFLTLNVDKTEFMILGNPPLIRKVNDVTLKIGDATIKPTDCLRDLGLYLDPTLTLKHHITRICSRAFTALRMIGRLRRSLSLQSRQLLLHALVLSHVDYCLATLFKVPNEYLKKIQRVINSTFRFLHSIKKGTSSKAKRQSSS